MPQPFATAQPLQPVESVAPLSFRVSSFEEVSSTNDIIKEALAKGEPEGLVVRARRQVAGYGRQGRAWVSPEGGLYCSWLLRPRVAPEEMSTLSLVAALALRNTVLHLAPAEAQNILVKWPNDVLYGSRKLCGISLEACHKGLCLGTGINVMPPKTRCEVGGKNTPAYVSEFSQEVAKKECFQALDWVFHVLGNEFSVLYNRWQQKGFSSLCAEYNQVAALVGSHVRVVNREQEALVEGKVQGIGEKGCLLVQPKEGPCQEIYSGEAHLL